MSISSIFEVVVKDLAESALAGFGFWVRLIGLEDHHPHNWLVGAGSVFATHYCFAV